MSKYAAVVMNIEHQAFHYLIPNHLVGQVQIGCRVLVPLNNQRREGFVVDLPLDSNLENLRTIIELIDPIPIISEELVQIALWVSETYLCSAYGVLEYIVPPYARTQPIRWVRLNRSPQELKTISVLDEQLGQLIAILAAGPVKKQLVLKKLGKEQEIYLQDLENQGIVETFISYEFRGQNKYLTFLKANILEEELNDILYDLKRAPKQQEIIKYLVVNGPESQINICRKLETSTGPIRALEEKGLLKRFQVREKRKPALDKIFQHKKKVQLNIDQRKAMAVIDEYLINEQAATILLHGVTGSGKTEIYIQAVQKSLEMGRGALVLVPEISLTPQTIGRFTAVLKENVVVLHSALSQGERLDAWNSLRQGLAKVVVGVRSAVFAPVQNLGLIIIDEEHESTFKQSEPNPRYHARDVALERMRINQGVLVLGSATPAIESYYRAEQGEYHLLELPQRATEHSLPQGIVVDLREEFKKGNKSIFSNVLKEYINEALLNSEQIILFLNRRGYSTFVLCRECGQVIDCQNCAIALTYHAFSQDLKCHYCFYTQPVPRRCPNCGSGFIKYFGSGTQMVETMVKKNWPGIRVDRLDMDTTRNKDAHQRILAKFANGETDLLIGTQMVTKGLDFPNVTVVGIIAADTALNLPDYAAGEKTFQLITQVAGRAGRGLKKGKVVIQTYNPDHYSIQAGKEQNYHLFYQQELQVRKILNYPPFAHLVRILITGLVDNLVQRGASMIAEYITNKYIDNLEILGPASAPIEKIKNRFRWQIILKGKDLALLRAAAASGRNCVDNKEIRIIIDIEPQSIL